MAAIKNAIDNILQAANPRIVQSVLPPNIIVGSGNIGAGTGKNLLPNAGFYLGFDKWSYTPGFSLNLPSWSLSAIQSTAWFGGNFSAGTGDAYLYIDGAQRIPVIAGQTIEVSAYTGAHRCSVAVVADFYDQSGNNIGQGQQLAGDKINTGDYEGGAALIGYKRCYSFQKAPAGAVSARFIFQKLATNSGQPSSYAFITLPFLGIAGANQAELSPWSDGIGGQTTIISPSNYLSYMAQGAVSGMAYANTYGGTQSTINTYLSFNSDAQNVLLHLSITLTTKVSDSNGGRCNVYYNLYINGSLYRTRNMVHLPNMTTAFAAMVNATAIVYVPAPPAGTVEYRAEFVPFFDGNGTGGKIENGSIEIIGLKR
jgi:hypothetical protein